ncbi:MAG: IS4 family transposase [Burkholderiaceae bacterium]|jgi:IS4 transposase|nr:IS4 family transposase [Burkholderiaceae bacterium]
MFRISQFQELIKPISRAGFNQMAARHKADKHSKGFGCWEQLIAMLYAQLSGATSLRQVEAGFNSQQTHHYHLGTRPIRRWALADANSKRPTGVFSDMAHALMTYVQRKVRRDAGELLYLLDWTSITLKGRHFDDWTRQQRTRNTQGVKLHLMVLKGEDTVPCEQSITMANVNDIDQALKLPLQPGARYVFDKGYCDYNWWARMDRTGAHFVTRFKRNAALRVEQRLDIGADAAGGVLADEIVGFRHRCPGGARRNGYTQPLRRITVARPDKTPLVLATNDLTSDTQAIAAHYRARWQIELYFKWIKQHLRVKQFLGRSHNAVCIQLLTALIAYLLLVLYRRRHARTDNLWTLLGQLRATLFQRPQLEALRHRRRREQQQAFERLQPQLL